MIVPADSPYQTIEEFIDYAKANPGALQLANTGMRNIWQPSVSNCRLALIPIALHRQLLLFWADMLMLSSAPQLKWRLPPET